MRAGTEALNGDDWSLESPRGSGLEAQCVQRLFFCSLHMSRDGQERMLRSGVPGASQGCGSGMEENFKVGAESLSPSWLCPSLPGLPPADL